MLTKYTHVVGLQRAGSHGIVQRRFEVFLVPAVFDLVVSFIFPRTNFGDCPAINCFLNKSFACFAVLHFVSKTVRLAVVVHLNEQDLSSNDSVDTVFRIGAII